MEREKKRIKFVLYSSLIIYFLNPNALSLLYSTVHCHSAPNCVSHFAHNCSNVKKKVEINKNKRGPSVPYPYRIHLCVKNIKFK